LDANTLDNEVLDRLINDEEKFLNKYANKLRCDNKQNDYHLFNRILGLTNEVTWKNCNDAKDYIRTMYEILYPIIKTQRQYLDLQSKELARAKALDKAKLKKEMRVYKDKLALAVQELDDLLKTNALMIDKLKQHGLYDKEGTAFNKTLSEEEVKKKINELPTRRRFSKVCIKRAK